MINGRPKKEKRFLKISISLDPEIADYLDILCDLTQLKRSQIISMAIKHFYKACVTQNE